MLCRSRAACPTRLPLLQLWWAALWEWESWDTLASPCHRSTKHAAARRLAVFSHEWSRRACLIGL